MVYMRSTAVASFFKRTCNVTLLHTDYKLQRQNDK